MKEIVVTSQTELDALPVDFDGRIIVKFGTPYNRAVINRRFKCRVVAWGNSSVVARENSSVVARENSSVVAWGNSSVVAWGNSSVEARENSSVVAWGNSSVVAWENSSVEARENSSVVARENSSVVARENSSVVAWGNSSVEARENSSVVARENSSVVARENSSVVAWENSSVVAWGNSSVVAWGNSSVEARGNSSVEARENSSVEAWGNSQICDCTRTRKINTSGKARIVYNPRNIDEYCDHYGIERNENTVKLYKAVHKKNGRYFSDYDPSFEYIMGQTTTADNIDKNVDCDCGCGIHIAYTEWAVEYGRAWKDLAIIEVEVETSSIIVPVDGCGKVRTGSVNVLREVPLEECGLLGKILAKKKR